MIAIRKGENIHNTDRRRRRRVPIEACGDISEALYEERRGRQEKR
jgi:uncharacterized membrane-anchored protein